MQQIQKTHNTTTDTDVEPFGTEQDILGATDHLLDEIDDVLTASETAGDDLLLGGRARPESLQGEGRSHGQPRLGPPVGQLEGMDPRRRG